MPTTTTNRREGRGGGDLCLRKEGGRGALESPLVSIRGDNTQLFEFAPARPARHGLKFNENSPAIKLLDAMYTGAGWFINLAITRFTAHCGLSSISFDFAGILYACVFPLEKISDSPPCLRGTLFLSYRLHSSFNP